MVGGWSFGPAAFAMITVGASDDPKRHHKQMNIYLRRGSSSLICVEMKSTISSTVGGAICVCISYSFTTCTRSSAITKLLERFAISQSMHTPNSVSIISLHGKYGYESTVQRPATPSNSMVELNPYKTPTAKGSR